MHICLQYRFFRTLPGNISQKYRILRSSNPMKGSVMFKIEELYVDDKRLPELLRRLVGIAAGQPVAVPVVGAEIKKDKVVAKPRAELGLRERIANAILKSGVETLNIEDLRGMLVATGAMPSSSSYVIQFLRKQKILSRVPGTRAKWSVNRKVT